MNGSTLHKMGASTARPERGDIGDRKQLKRERRLAGGALPDDKFAIAHVRCHGKMHRIAWQPDGRILLVDHNLTSRIADRTLVALGKEPCACAAALANIVSAIRKENNRKPPPAKLRDEVRRCTHRHEARRGARYGGYVTEALRDFQYHLNHRGGSKDVAAYNRGSLVARKAREASRIRLDISSAFVNHAGIGATEHTIGKPGARVTAMTVGVEVLASFTTTLLWRCRVKGRGFAVLPNDLLGLDAEESPDGKRATVTTAQMLVVRQPNGYHTPLFVVRRVIVERQFRLRAGVGGASLEPDGLRYVGVIHNDGTVQRTDAPHLMGLDARAVPFASRTLAD